MLPLLSVQLPVEVVGGLQIVAGVEAAWVELELVEEQEVELEVEMLVEHLVLVLDLLPSMMEGLQAQVPVGLPFCSSLVCLSQLSRASDT